jgi:hypothetical protein
VWSLPLALGLSHRGKAAGLPIAAWRTAKPVAKSITQAEASRRNAEQCERTAALAIDPGAKGGYTELAGQWRQRAEQAEVLARRLGKKLIDKPRAFCLSRRLRQSAGRTLR